MRILRIGGAKCVLAISVMAMGMAGTASAALTACPATNPLPYKITPSSVITDGNSVVDSSFTCGGLSFSNFSEVDAGGSSTPTPWTGYFNLVTAGAGGGVVNLGFNPNLTPTTTATSDLWFFFTVSGAGLDQVDLSVNGVGASVSETICSAAFTANGTCTGTVLTSLGNTGATNKLSGTFGPVSTIYIFKDIKVGGVGTDPGHLTSIGQSFHATTTVPEPATLSMMGLGLLGLGLIGRRRKS
jgi:hypothetical protein